jgi:uncharacterized coiled-coil protein SlyX
MDCSPEYVVGYYDEDKDVPPIICHSFKMAGIFDSSPSRMFVKSFKDDVFQDEERKRLSTLNIIPREKGIDSSWDAEIASFSKSFASKQLMEYKKSSSRQRRWTKRMQKHSEMHQKKRAVDQANEWKLIGRLGDSRNPLQEKMKTVATLHKDLKEQRMMVASKKNAVGILTRRFEGYKVSTYYYTAVSIRVFVKNHWILYCFYTSNP